VLANPPKSQQPKANNALQDLDGLDGHNQLPKLIFGVNSSAGLRLSPSRPAVGSQPPPLAAATAAQVAWSVLTAAN
jgi:hypothetical protein